MKHDQRAPALGRFTIGLTGGIGSGKSMVGRLFAQLGATVIDTDEIAHRLTAPQGKAIGAIRDQFGETVITPDHALDRVKMRALVFSDPGAKKKLEAILHPMIRSECEQESLHAPGSYIIFAVPLLVESGNWAERVARVLVVDCPEELQIERVMKRNHFDEDQVRAILANQATRQARLAAADDVIMNDGDIESLVPQVEKLHTLYTSLAGNGKPGRLQDL